jgi:hypothetical protein
VRVFYLSGALSVAAAVEVPAAAVPAAGIAMNGTSVAVITGIRSPVVASDVPMSVASPVVAAVPIARVTPISNMLPVIPRTGADKNAAHKPPWAVVPIRRTGIRVVGIVSIRTNRRPSRRIIVGVTWADVHTNSHSDLRLRISKRYRQQCQQRQIF